MGSDFQTFEKRGSKVKLLKKAQMPQIALAGIILSMLILIEVINQSSTSNILDLSLTQSNCPINIELRQNTIVRWTNNDVNKQTYYMTFQGQKDIIQLGPGVSYGILLNAQGKFEYSCGLDRNSLKNATIDVKPWWKLLFKFN